MSDIPENKPGLGRRRALMLAPLGLAVAGGAGFYAMLRGMGTGTYDPRGVPSALVGRAAPPFACHRWKPPGCPPSPIPT
jgi:cytochrome c biogenesis protein CcmG/thiol:disulfide interchange protein DsbE